MVFTPKKIPAIPDISRLGQGLLQDTLRAIKTALETRLLGLHGEPDQVVLKGQLGVPLFDLLVTTALSGGAKNLLRQTVTLGVVDGIITVIGDETTAAEVVPKAYMDIAMGLTAYPNGAAAPDLVAWNGGAISVYSFDGATITEQLFGNCEYNHCFKEGADIHPHIHWAPTTADAGDVKWGLTYVWDNPGEGPGAETTIYATVAAPGVAFRQQFASFPAISGAGKKIGSQFQFRLFRNPTDAADTYTKDAVIQTMGIHAEVDSFGSTSLSTK